MLSKRFRFVFVAILIGYGIYLTGTEGLGRSWIAFLAALMMVLGHFWFGTVWAASKLIHKGELEKAQRLLDDIRRPDFLLKKYRAEYYFMQGVLSLYEKDLAKGETNLNRALNIGLQSNNSRALAYLNLAHLCIVKNRFAEAKQYLNKGKEIEANLHVLKQMEALEAKIAEQEN